MAYSKQTWVDGDKAKPLSAARMSHIEDGIANAVPSDAVALAANPDSIIVGAITRDANGAATSASVAWPDGSTGTYTGTPSSAFPGAIDTYTITKGAKTYTQPAVTRDPSTGAVTNRPAITVA